MSTTLVQIRIDNTLKENASEIYAKLGLDLPTAIRMFLTRSVIENGIPFSMTLPKEPYCAEKGLKAMMELSDDALKNNTSEMSEEEIEKEIDNYRKGK